MLLISMPHQQAVVAYRIQHPCMSINLPSVLQRIRQQQVESHQPAASCVVKQQHGIQLHTSNGSA